MWSTKTLWNTALFDLAGSQAVLRPRDVKMSQRSCASCGKVAAGDRGILVPVVDDVRVICTAFELSASFFAMVSGDDPFDD